MEPRWALLFPILVLLLLCFFWWSLISSFKKLNGAKFQIVGAFEMRLPASPYKKAEWDTLLKHGRDRRTYWPLNHVESWIPVVFAFGYMVAAVALWSRT